MTYATVVELAFRGIGVLVAISCLVLAVVRQHDALANQCHAFALLCFVVFACLLAFFNVTTWSCCIHRCVFFGAVAGVVCCSGGGARPDPTSGARSSQVRG